MFKVRGKIDGRTVEAEWNDGQLAGDGQAVWQSRVVAESSEGREIGPACGPYTTTQHLSDPLSAVFILRQVFDEGAEFSGDVPEPPPVPEGAVI